MGLAGSIALLSSGVGRSRGRTSAAVIVVVVTIVMVLQYCGSFILHKFTHLSSHTYHIDRIGGRRIVDDVAWLGAPPVGDPQSLDRASR